MAKQQASHSAMFTLAGLSLVVIGAISGMADAEDLRASASAAPSFELPALAPSAIVLNSQATYRVENERVKFYFVPGKADIAPGVNQALQDFVDGMDAHERLEVTAYFEDNLDSSTPALLAQQRLKAVVGKFQSMGMDAAQIATQTVALSEAHRIQGKNRRVEVNIIAP
ncbi:MAG: hypothetical protein ACI4QS_04910 [Comamonas sp.]